MTDDKAPNDDDVTSLNLKRGEMNGFILVSLAKQANLNVRIAGMLTDLAEARFVDRQRVAEMLTLVHEIGEELEDFIARAGLDKV